MPLKIALFLLILFCQTSFAQFTQTDKNLLEKELTFLINELRISKELEPLVPNNILSKAAENHSEYLVTTKKLSHWQIDAKLAYPSKRVEHFGGNDFKLVGENVLSSKPQRIPLNNKTIKKLAGEMFMAWKNSTGHYANMIDVDYLLGDLGFALDKETKIIYVTHVFGQKGIRIPNQLSSNAFGIKDLSEECDDKDINYLANIVANLGDNLHIEGNKVIFRYHNKSLFNRVFVNANDGIAVDIISRNQVQCSQANKLDMSPIHDGVLLKPIFKKELLSKNTAKNDYRIVTEIGTIPNELIRQDLEFSVVLIKNGNKCRYLMPLCLPRKMYSLLPIEPNMGKPSLVELSGKGIIAIQKLQYDFETNITIPIRNPEIEDLIAPVHSVDIFSYSSIEGDAHQNEKLHTGRAASIKNHIIESLGINASKIKIDAKENWEKMYFQLKYYNAEKLQNQSKKFIKASVRKDHTIPWDSLLFQQRKSIAIINYGNFSGLISPRSQLAEMNLRMAIKNHNISLANKALYELYQTDLNNPSILFEDAILNAISHQPSGLTHKFRYVKMQ